MVAVVVSDETPVNGWKLFHTEPGSDVAPDESGDPLSEDRVNEQRGAGDLNEPARMAEPGETGTFSANRWTGKHGQVRRNTGDIGPRWRAAASASEPVHDGPAEAFSRRAGPCAIDVEVPECFHPCLRNLIGSCLP